MPWIENVSKRAVQEGIHGSVENTILIQISDFSTEHPIPKYQFEEVYQFDFMDIEEDGMSNNGTGEMEDMSMYAISEEQSKEIVKILKTALKNNKNVIVHCHAGVARSGAVAEIGITLGFEDTESVNYRNPNTLVIKKLMDILKHEGIN